MKILWNWKDNEWSYIILFLITGVFGAFLLVFIGYVITKIIKSVSPATKRIGFENISFDNYGWRGGSVLIFTGTFFYIGLMVWMFFFENPPNYDNDLTSNILRVVFSAFLLILCYAGLKQFEPIVDNKNI